MVTIDISDPSIKVGDYFVDVSFSTNTVIQAFKIKDEVIEFLLVDFPEKCWYVNKNYQTTLVRLTEQEAMWMLLHGKKLDTA